MNEFQKDRVRASVVSYLRSRAAAEMAGNEYSPDHSMLSKAADMIEEGQARLAEAKQRIVSLQRVIGEYEARDIGGVA
jgi:hypothetical protein